MPNPSAPGAPARGAQALLAASYALPAAIVFALLAADHLPRFMQGDSISYLMTSAAWKPPDRSWAFGFAVSFLVRATRSHLTYLLLNGALLVAVIMGCRSLFGRTRAGLVAFTACATAVAADPLTAAYARFYLSDFWAMAFFVGLTATLLPFLRGAPRRAALLAALLVLTVGAVFTRVAYAPVILVTAALMLSWSWRRGPAARWRALAVAALPVVAAAALAGCNATLFASQLGGQPFVNRLSGTFMMGVFAPALEQRDFTRAGVPLSDQEYRDLQLQDYDKRIAQVWGGTAGARHLVMDRLGDHDEYSAAVDRTCMAVVVNAFKRKPLTFAKVYLHSLALHFSIGEWRKFFETESGADRPLEAGFVEDFNRRVFTKIYPDITKEPSLTLSLYRTALPFYPPFLGLCSAVAVFLLLSRRSGTVEAAASAAFIAALVAAPLYSNYVIPRYVLACVVLGYVLIGLLLQRALAGRHHQPTPAA